MMKNIAVIIIILFSFFGFVIFSNIIHELSHVHDLKAIAEDGEICALVFQANFSKIAYYSFKRKPESEEEYERIGKYTEYKAYFFDILISILYLFCFYTTLKYVLAKKDGNRN